MAALPRCPSCDGFVPSSAQACPHCGAADASLRARVGFWLKAAGGGVVAVTMMACYGVPPDGPYPDDDSTTSETDEGTASEDGTSSMMEDDMESPSLRASERPGDDEPEPESDAVIVGAMGELRPAP